MRCASPHYGHVNTIDEGQRRILRYRRLQIYNSDSIKITMIESLRLLLELFYSSHRGNGSGRPYRPDYLITFNVQDPAPMADK